MIMSKYRQHLSGISQVFIGQASAAVLSLLTQVVIARSFEPDIRGVYAVCLILATSTHLLTFFGAEFGVRFLLLKKKITHSEAIILLATTISASCLFGLTLMLMASLFPQLEVFISKSLIFALLMVVSHTFAVQLNVLLTIQQRFKFAAIIAILHELTKFGLVLVTLNFFASLEAAFLSQALANLIVSAICIYFGGSGPIKKLWASWSNLRFVYWHGMKSSMYAFSNFGILHGPTAVLSFYVSASSVGLFAVAYGLVSRIQIIPDALNRYLVPTLNTSKHLSEQQANVKVAMLTLLLICCVIVSFLVIGSNYITVALFGDPYAGAAPLIAILSIGFCARTVCKPVEAFINEVMGSAFVVSTSYAITLTATLAAIALLAEKHGVTGASVATTLGLTVSALSLCLIFVRILPREAEQNT